MFEFGLRLPPPRIAQCRNVEDLRQKIKESHAAICQRAFTAGLPPEPSEDNFGRCRCLNMHYSLLTLQILCQTITLTETIPK